MSATGAYNATHLTLWDDIKVRALAPDARTLFVYLLTNSHRVAEGFYSLPVALTCDRLAWDQVRLRIAATALAESGLATYRLDAEAVLIRKGLKFNPPRGPKQIPAAVKKLETVQDAPDLFAAFLAAADKYAPPFADAIRARYGLTRIGNPGSATQGGIPGVGVGEGVGDGAGGGVGVGEGDGDGVGGGAGE